MGTLQLRLPILRAERRLSQRQLAALAGVRPDTISALERGDTAGIQFATLVRLCEVLRCTPGDILLFNPDPDDHQAPVLGGDDEDAIVEERLRQLDQAPRVDGPSFLEALMRRAESEASPVSHRR